jgi:hypothetical protein
MQAYYSFKHSLKQVRWRVRRARAVVRWGFESLNHTPIVFGNAMPKSGSHLITQVLRGLMQLGPFVDPGLPPVNRAEDNTNLPAELILAGLEAMQPGDVRYGYLPAERSYLEFLNRPEVAAVYIYRDPRDMVVSHVFYATEMHTGHGMHRYYTETLNSTEERIAAAIRGVSQNGFEMRSVNARYRAYQDWLQQPAVLAVRFEELIGDREATLNKLLDYLAKKGFQPREPRAEAIRVLSRALDPRKSGTFRKAQPGNWREHFTEANKHLFKEQTGDLLITLGYEKSNDW